MWQTVAVWLVIGMVVIWMVSKWLRRRVFRDRNNPNDKPPCCR